MYHLSGNPFTQSEVGSIIGVICKCRLTQHAKLAVSRFGRGVTFLARCIAKLVFGMFSSRCDRYLDIFLDTALTITKCPITYLFYFNDFISLGCLFVLVDVN